MCSGPVSSAFGLKIECSGFGSWPGYLRSLPGMQAVKMLELVLFMFQKAGGWCGDVNHFVQVLPV